MMATRSLKIVYSFSTTPKALLPLKGNWLEQAGFSIGMRVDVIVRQQCLVILPAAQRDDLPAAKKARD